MLLFLILFIMLISFLLPCFTIIRITLIALLNNNKYLIHDLVFILGIRFIGTFVALFYFKKIYSYLGSLRLLTISITFLTQCMIGLFYFQSVNYKLLFMFFLGFFEHLSISIIKPIILDLIKQNYYKHFDIFSNNLVRIISGFLIILDHEQVMFLIISILLSVLIIYILSDARNRFKKDHIIAHDTHLMEVYLKYNEYFWCSFLSNFVFTITFLYLAIFYKIGNYNTAASFLTFYLWGQFLFSYPLEFLANYFSNRLYSVAICFLNIILLIFHIYGINNKIAYYFYSFNAISVLSISLLGGVSTLSHKYRFKSMSNWSENISINVTEDQIKSIASLSAAITSIMLVNINPLIFWFALIGVNLINIIQTLIRHVKIK